jgi:2-dehydropantoate 2-reductase
MDKHLSQLRCLCFGAGALGTYIGGSLAAAGAELVFLERPDVARVLRERGLRLDLTADRRWGEEPLMLQTAAVTFAQTLEEALAQGPFDVALYALKSFDTAGAIHMMRPYAAQMPPVCCFSNGVDNEPALAEVLGPEKVIAATVTSAIGRRGPGDIVLERLRGVGIDATHPLSERLLTAANAALLNAKPFRNSAAMKWSKMLTNLIANPTSAILDMTAAEIFMHSALYELEIGMLRECLDVMRAQRIPIVDLPGVPTRALAFLIRLPTWMSKPFLARAAGAGRGGKMPSFHIDLHSGRGQSEVEFLHGAVARAGRRYGVATPINAYLSQTLVALTEGRIAMDLYAHKPAKLLADVRARRS